MVRMHTGAYHANAHERNEFGCALRFQTGASAVKQFAAVVANLPPDMRAAFESERAARQAELEAYVKAHGYRT